jgi:hypothetical protein
VGPEPQAFRLDFDANYPLKAHFHAVDQFQIFIAGGGKIGKHTVQSVMVHYADHHTPYGPIVAGERGISYLTLRSKTDSGMVTVPRPGLAEQSQRSKRRHRNSSPIELSPLERLRAQTRATVESVMDHRVGDDGLDAIIVRLGPGWDLAAPEARGSGGQYHVVLNGSLRLDGKELRPYSLLFVAPDEPPPTLTAGDDGVELLIAQFPAQDSWMTSL